jgi:hypothetical protein
LRQAGAPPFLNGVARKTQRICEDILGPAELKAWQALDATWTSHRQGAALFPGKAQPFLQVIVALLSAIAVLARFPGQEWVSCARSTEPEPFSRSL